VNAARECRNPAQRDCRLHAPVELLAAVASSECSIDEPLTHSSCFPIQRTARHASLQPGRLHTLRAEA
jgi:hypothetical protein